MNGKHKYCACEPVNPSVYLLLKNPFESPSNWHQCLLKALCKYSLTVLFYRPSRSCFSILLFTPPPCGGFLSFWWQFLTLTADYSFLLSLPDQYCWNFSNSLKTYWKLFRKQVLLGQKDVMARIRWALRSAGPNDFMFVYNLIHRDLTISILYVLIFIFW